MTSRLRVLEEQGLGTFREPSDGVPGATSMVGRECARSSVDVESGSNGEIQNV